MTIQRFVIHGFIGYENGCTSHFGILLVDGNGFMVVLDKKKIVRQILIYYWLIRMAQGP